MYCLKSLESMGILCHVANISNVIGYFPARMVLQSLVESNKIKGALYLYGNAKGFEYVKHLKTWSA